MDEEQVYPHAAYLSYMDHSLDPNNFISRVRDLRTRNRLVREKEYYMGRIEEDRRKLNELRTSNENLEKYAREQYLMKKPDEDLFIIVTPGEERKIQA